MTIHLISYSQHSLIKVVENHITEKHSKVSRRNSCNATLFVDVDVDAGLQVLSYKTTIRDGAVEVGLNPVEAEARPEVNADFIIE